MASKKDIKSQMTREQNGQKKFDLAIIPAKDEAAAFTGTHYIENRPAFILWQYIGGIEVPEGFELKDYRPIVKKWYGISQEILVDQHGEIPSFTEVWSLFEDVVLNNRVKHFKINAFELAKQRSRNRKTPLPEAVENDYDQAYQYLLAVCYELQNIAGDEPFFITGEQAGNILGRSQPVGHAALKMFVNHGILERVKIGHTGVSSEYRYKKPAD